jgi:hypothetical protein
MSRTPRTVAESQRCWLSPRPVSDHDAELQSILHETKYLLDRWRIAVSAAGFLWIQPVGPKLSPEELAGLLMLLKRGCDAEFPKALLFDFHDVEVVGAQWTLIEELLIDMARGIGAQCRLTSNSRRPAASFLLHRGETATLPECPGFG